MTLSEACEPLFQRICQLNRLRRTGGTCPDFKTLRREMPDLLGKVRSTMLADPALDRHWTELELPLIFFIDSMISESDLPAAAEWNQKRLAYDRRELAGDQKFFDLLDQTLADPGTDATARLAVFYTCIGLGFCGWYAGRPEALRTRMQEMLTRIDSAARMDMRFRICSEAYEHVDTRDLVQPPPIPAAVLAGLFAGLCLICVAVNIYLYQEGTLPLRSDLREIMTHKLDGPPPKVGLIL